MLFRETFWYQCLGVGRCPGAEPELKLGFGFVIHKTCQNVGMAGLAFFEVLYWHHSEHGVLDLAAFGFVILDNLSTRCSSLIRFE